LPGKKAGSYLLEEYALATAGHGQQLHELLSRAAPRGKEALLVGGVRYDSVVPAGNPDGPAHRGPARTGGKHLRWKYLLWTKKEAEQLHDLGTGRASPTLLEGARATEGAVRQRMPRARYVHLATHGFFSDPALSPPRRPSAAGPSLGKFKSPGRDASASVRSPLLLSGVVLAGANLLPKLDAQGLPVGDDGILTGEEVAELDLANTELVVLSACETGLGEVAGGEGVFGLQRAFHLAGARTVVASLWQVDDRATQQLMTRFYANLWKKDLPQLEAFRQAQLALLRGETADGPKRGLELDKTEPAKGTGSAARLPPRLWAAWVLSGSPGRLRLSGTSVRPTR
jgi:CHAT domain-containing protein